MIAIAPFVGFGVFMALLIWVGIFYVDQEVELPSIEEVSMCVEQRDPDYCLDMFKEQIEEQQQSPWSY